MIHILTLKEGLETKYENIQYSRQGFIARNKISGQQEGLPLDAFAITPLDRLLPELFSEIERKVTEEVVSHAKMISAQIADEAIKLMVEKANAGNVS